MKTNFNYFLKGFLGGNRMVWIGENGHETGSEKNAIIMSDDDINTLSQDKIDFIVKKARESILNPELVNSSNDYIKSHVSRLKTLISQYERLSNTPHSLNSNDNDDALKSRAVYMRSALRSIMTLQNGSAEGAKRTKPTEKKVVQNSVANNTEKPKAKTSSNVTQGDQAKMDQEWNKGSSVFSRRGVSTGGILNSGNKNYSNLVDNSSSGDTHDLKLASTGKVKPIVPKGNTDRPVVPSTAAPSAPSVVGLGMTQVNGPRVNDDRNGDGDRNESVSIDPDLPNLLSSLLPRLSYFESELNRSSENRSELRTVIVQSDVLKGMLSSIRGLTDAQKTLISSIPTDCQCKIELQKGPVTKIVPKLYRTKPDSRLASNS